MQTPTLTDIFIVLSFKPALEKENASQIQGKGLSSSKKKFGKEVGNKIIRDECEESFPHLHRFNGILKKKSSGMYFIVYNLYIISLYFVVYN